MAHGGAHHAAPALRRTIRVREDQQLSALGTDCLPEALRPRPLFDQQEFASAVVPIGLAQERRRLQRKRDLPVPVLVQALEATDGSPS